MAGALIAKVKSNKTMNNKNTENNTKEKIIKDAQYRKGLSIAFFNATNAAIALVTNSVLVKNGELKKDEECIKFLIQNYRDWFLDEHKNYYASVIANVGQNYKAEESIKKLKSAKNLEQLQGVWLLLSEDERRDESIRKVANGLKKEYGNEKV